MNGVSKRWFEFGPESKFAHPILTSISPQFTSAYLNLTSFEPLFYLFKKPLLSRQSRTTVWKPTIELLGRLTCPESPYSPNLGGGDSPPKFGG